MMFIHKSAHYLRKAITMTSKQIQGSCDVEKIEKSLLYIWSECVLEIVSAKQYKDIQKLFEERIKNV